MLRTRSICSSVVATAASPASVTGTNTDQNCAPSLPCASRGRSVWVKLTGAAMLVCTAPASRSCQGRSLWPSMSGERASRAVASSRRLVTGSAYAAHIIASLAGRRAGGARASSAHGRAGGTQIGRVGGWVLGAGTSRSSVRPGGRGAPRRPLPARPSRIYLQDASTVDLVSRQVGQRLVGLIKRIRGGGDLDSK